MKTLKSMLAVATAVGLATAVQAVQDKDVSTGFEKLSQGDTVTTGVKDNSNGYSYFYFTGSNDDDNESTIVAFEDNESPVARPKGVSRFTDADSTARTNALQVSTGTDPLLRTFLPAPGSNGGTPSKSPIEEVTYIDTLVQFTVTPSTDNVTPGEDDKLMIYLKESIVSNNTDVASDGTDAESGEPASTPPVTNLVVLAGFHGAEGVVSYEYNVMNPGLTVVPGKWYRLTVKVIPDVTLYFDEETEEYAHADSSHVGFSVYIDGTQCVFDKMIYDETIETEDAPGYLYIDSVYNSEANGAQIDNKEILLSLLAENDYKSLNNSGQPALCAVGFAGEGMVDDLVYTTSDPFASTVDFTLAFGADNTISSVEYTVGGTEGTIQNRTFEDVVVGSLVEIKDIGFADGYEFDKYTLAGVTQEATTTEGSIATFKINDDATGNVSLTIVAKEKAATYPTYVADADDTVKGNYDTWLGGVSGIAAGGDASGYENQFLLNQAASTTIADNALVIKSITENTNGGWDIVIGCSVEGVGLSTTEGENAQVCNGYLAVSYTSDLSGSWTKENINVEAGTETGTVKVNVNKNGAKFMKVSLETTKTSTTQE